MKTNDFLNALSKAAAATQPLDAPLSPNEEQGDVSERLPEKSAMPPDPRESRESGQLMINSETTEAQTEKSKPSRKARRGNTDARSASNHQVVTFSLFENDRRAIEAIQERLSAELRTGNVNRSDAVKVAIRLARGGEAKLLAQIYQEVKTEDGRYRPSRQK